jgi:site-specific DNA-methyltransferase (adenine-specific)
MEAFPLDPYYDDGTCVIYHGDCREVIPSLSAQSVGVVMTDPPFSVPVKYQDADGIHPRSWGDLLVMEPFFAEVFRSLRRVTKDAAHVYVCCDADTYPVFYKVGYPIWPQSQMIVWYKPTGRRGRGWLHSFELVAHFRTPQTRYTDGFRQDVIGIMPVRTLNRQHPAEKPGDLWTFLSEGVPANQTGAVLDPFMGGGSALRWCKDRGMKAIGIEIEERYCEIAAKRLGQGVLDFGEAS